MRNTKHNLIAQTYALQSFRVTGVMQYQIAGQWYERPVTETVRCERITQARDKALAQVEKAAREIDPLAVVRWHTPEWVRVEVTE